MLFFTQVIYAKYMISRNFEINANSAKFYFDVISKEESETIKFNANKAEFNLQIKNNDGTNFNTFDTSYEIKLLNNDKYTFSVGNISDTNGILIQNLKGNELLNEDVTIIFQPKANADVKLVENLQINIKVIGPYIESKEYKFPLTIIEN